MKLKLFIEKYFPLMFSTLVVVVIYLIKIHCKIPILNILSDSILESDSLSVIITIEGILFGATLTFLGLFMQMNNKTMNFIVEKSPLVLRNIICYLIRAIASTIVMVVFSYILFLLKEKLCSFCCWIWFWGLIYSFSALIRVLYAYTIVITPSKRDKGKKNKRIPYTNFDLD